MLLERLVSVASNGVKGYDQKDQELRRSKPARRAFSDLENADFVAILYKLKLNQSVTTIPTVGFNVETVTYKNVKFNVWVSWPFDQIAQFFGVGGTNCLRDISSCGGNRAIVELVGVYTPADIGRGSKGIPPSI